MDESTPTLFSKYELKRYFELILLESSAVNEGEGDPARVLQVCNGQTRNAGLGDEGKRHVDVGPFERFVFVEGDDLSDIRECGPLLGQQIAACGVTMGRIVLRNPILEHPYARPPNFYSDRSGDPRGSGRERPPALAQVALDRVSALRWLECRSTCVLPKVRSAKSRL